MTIKLVPERTYFNPADDNFDLDALREKFIRMGIKIDKDYGTYRFLGTREAIIRDNYILRFDVDKNLSWDSLRIYDGDDQNYINFDDFMNEPFFTISESCDSVNVKDVSDQPSIPKSTKDSMLEVREYLEDQAHSILRDHLPSELFKEYHELLEMVHNIDKLIKEIR